MVSSGETMTGGNGDAMSDEVMDMMEEEGDDSQKAAAALIGLVSRWTYHDTPDTINTASSHTPPRTARCWHGAFEKSGTIFPREYASSRQKFVLHQVTKACRTSRGNFSSFFPRRCGS